MINFLAKLLGGIFVFIVLLFFVGMCAAIFTGDSDETEPEKPVKVEAIQTKKPSVKPAQAKPKPKSLILLAKKDSILLATPTDEELKTVFNRTKGPVGIKILDKKGAVVEKFPDALSLHDVKRTAQIVGDNLILGYLLRYKVWYRYKTQSVKRYTWADIDIRHNVKDGTYNVISINMPELNAFVAKQRVAEQKKSTNDEEVQKGLAYIISKDVVKARLKSPSTAKFPSIIWNSESIKVLHLGNEKYRVRAHVDAPNSFGAMIRQNYSVVIELINGGRQYRATELNLY